MLERGERTTRKPFDLRGSRVEVEVTTYGASSDA
jgi:hypothetical protein